MRPLTFVAFVLGSYPGAMLYGWSYGAIMADSSGQLTSRTSVIAMLAGIPLCAAASGWAVAWLASRIFSDETKQKPKA